ncbi:MAG TPA: MBL fold metallo-hydrolase [Patescibacteria group bacterium]|nr:MBL fold metallo-hydrolase [Patescibacteria group bacterium]
MKIYPLEAGPVATYGYLITDSETKKAVLVDTPKDCAEPFLQLLKDENLELERILLTHSHWDHTADAAEMQRRTGAPIYLHKDDEYRATDPGKYLGWKLPFEIEAISIDEFLKEGDTIECGRWKFDVIHTPGHTEGGVCFIDHAMKIALVGDTLFKSSVGRTDLPGGDAKMLLKSIREKLLTLPDDYTVLPGHGDMTTIGAERKRNPFLKPEFFEGGDF